MIAARSFAAAILSLSACGGSRADPVTITIAPAPAPEVVIAEAPRVDRVDHLDGDEPPRGRPAPSASARAAPSGPKAVISILQLSISGGPVANARGVVAGMAAGFRRCVNREIAADPSAITPGGVKVIAKIGPNGEVLSVVPTGGVGLTKAAIACVLTRVSSAQFAPPDGGSATIEIPIALDLI